MSLPIEDLTPAHIVAELDRYIVGQHAAKRAVAVALRNRYRRQQLPPEDRAEISPRNILMIGPTGVGKTEIARRLAQLARAPFVKVEATKFTEVGYVGRDVEQMVRELVAGAVRLVEAERIAEVRDAAESAAEDRIAELVLDALDGPNRHWAALASDGPEPDWAALEAERSERLERIRRELADGLHHELEIAVDSEEASQPFFQVFSPQGTQEMGMDTQDMPGSPFAQTRHITRRIRVKDARELIVEIEAKRRIDKSSIIRDAVDRAEQTGIIFIDEIDKVAGSNSTTGPDVSREGVQRDLLPIIEGSVVPSKYGPIRTDHILFVAAGAFHMSKPSDLIPELQGRLPIRVELESLGAGDFARILTEPRNSLTWQYQQLLRADGVEIDFTEEALREVARLAVHVNFKTDDIGARRLHTMMERMLQDLLYQAPDVEVRKLMIDINYVKAKLSWVEQADLERTIL
jgi:ATP-dependent HslUV protease ATP-binding subunit HslU